MNEQGQPKLTREELRAKISTWQNRAYMAQQQGNEDLMLQALEQKHKYEKLLAALESASEI
ncbi:MAG: hypothetical protein K2X81_02040 [Candidatus Obscuribacterales bacterium]|nr:hypothetical protein [Candidatus Obscuribacterales bacterium]